MQSLVGVVRVTQLVDRLSDATDNSELPAGPEGKGSFMDYTVSLEYTPDMKNAAKEVILDEFHETHAIGSLDDFDVKVLRVSKVNR